jgi:hypothetical protein
MRHGTTAMVGLAAACLGGCDAAAPGVEGQTAVTAADLALLIPLEQTSTTGLAAIDSAGHGPVLSRALFDRLPALTRVDEPDALHQALTTVAVRLDPCFREGGPEAPCQPQVRLVLQPVFRDATGPDVARLVTRDAAVHAFHPVTRAAFDALVSELATLRESLGGQGGVGVPPDVEAAAALIAPHVGEGRLTRVTFMAVHASDEAWTFGGFERDPATGALTATPIPGAPDRHEQHLTSTGALATLDATILPAPAVEPAVAPLLRAEERDGLDAAGFDAAREALARVNNPASHDTGTVDCATCHVATAAAAFLTRQPGSPPTGPWADTRNQRMFGYFEATPSISPRVLAEVMAGLALLSEDPNP